MNWFVFMVVFSFVINSYKTQTSCPSICRCSSRNTVYCNGRNLSQIPYGIPETTIVLHLQQNNISNDKIANENFSALKRLKRLNFYQNKLTSVPSGLAKTLEYIDFRSNSIKYVGKLSLKGMSSLKELHLGENNITNQGLLAQVFKDTQNLEVLDLSKNLLNKFPKNLPKSLQVLRLNKNRIHFISFNATGRLKDLTLLDLSENRIIQTMIAHGALFKLTSLVTLDLSRNQLTQMPVGLPPRLEQLLLGSNKLEYIFNKENSQHGSLNSVKTLTNIDLSSNLLKSVESNAFSELHLMTIELQENPWQCDCYLRYLKQWLERKKTNLSNENYIKCSSPPDMANISLASIDKESLKCIIKPGSSINIQVRSINPTEVLIQWKSPFLTPDPAFITRYLTYGPMKCKKCTLNDFLSDSFSSRRITSFIESYSSQKLTSNLITVSKLQSDSRYLFCVSDSQSDNNVVTLNNCLVVETLPFSVFVTPDIPRFIPLWAIILCIVIICLLLFVVVIIVAVFAKKKNFRSKKRKRHTAKRKDFQMSNSTHSSQPNRRGTETSLSERAYSESRPVNSNSTLNKTFQNSAKESEELKPLIKKNFLAPDRRPTRSSER